MRRCCLILLLISAVVLLALSAAFPSGTPYPMDGAEARQGDTRLILREDLTLRMEAGWPVLLEVASTDALETVLMIQGAMPGEVSVRTFPLDTSSEVVFPVTSDDSIEYALPGNGQGMLLMLTFAEPGQYRVGIETDDGGMGTSIKLDISDGGPTMFGVPEQGDRVENWRDRIIVGDEVSISLSASVERWRDPPWGTYFNWTISVVCPEGMEVGGDLSIYNTGDTRVDDSILDRTSVVSAWQNGFNGISYTVWDEEGGTRLSGPAAMTPNGKELTMGAGTYDDWSKGSWRPFGTGTIRFNEAGHYLVVIYVSDADGPVSKPLISEVYIHPDKG